MNFIVLLLILGIIVWLWQSSLHYREYATRHCRRICNDLNLQLLDQTVILSGMSIVLSKRTSLRLRRSYNFEVSEDGATRHKGCIVILGRNIIHTEIDLPEGPLILQRNDLLHL